MGVRTQAKCLRRRAGRRGGTVFAAGMAKVVVALLAVAMQAHDGAAQSATAATATGSASLMPLSEARPNSEGADAFEGAGFGSLVADWVEARTAPAADSPVVVIFRRAGQPVRVLDGQGGWRQVQDQDSSMGWVRAELVSRRRTAVVIAAAGAPQSPILVRSSEWSGADVVASLEPGVVVDLLTCSGQACRISAAGLRGVIDQRQLWGTTSGEVVR